MLNGLTRQRRSSPVRLWRIKPLREVGPALRAGLGLQGGLGAGTQPASEKRSQPDFIVTVSLLLLGDRLALELRSELHHEIGHPG